MGFIDILVATGILAGAVYVLYRSIWKKKGHCAGCSGCCMNKLGNQDKK